MRGPTNLRAALFCALALCLAAGCDEKIDVDDDAGRDASAGPMDAGVDAGGGGEDDGGSGDDDAGSGGEDAGSDAGTSSEDDGGTSPEDDAGTEGEDAGMDGGFSMDGGMGEEDGGPEDGGTAVPVVINEYAYAHNTGFEGGNAHEYIEIFGAPNTDYSDLTILYVNGNAPASSGRIDNVIPVGTTDAMGYWVYHADPTMDVFRNSSSTLMLVRGFTGAAGDDLDADADGVLDASLPFTEIVDDVSMLDADETDHTYSATVLPRGFGGTSGNAAACSRIPNGVDTDSIADWVRNDGAGIGLPGGPTTADPGEGINTPGAENAIYSP